MTTFVILSSKGEGSSLDGSTGIRPFAEECLRALAISSSSFGSPARIDASRLLRTLESHSGSTTTARPTATRSAPILIAPSASPHVLIPPLAMTALRPAITRANSVIGLLCRGITFLDRTIINTGLSRRSALPIIIERNGDVVETQPGKFMTKQFGVLERITVRLGLKWRNAKPCDQLWTECVANRLRDRERKVHTL